MLLDIKKPSIMNALWKLQEPSDREVLTLVQKFELPEILARTLVNRGINLENVSNFLHPMIKSQLPDPFHLLDTKKAVARIIKAIDNDENIVIYGDYDVDGATSSALINRYFTAIGVHSIIYIPDRIDEGYGLNTGALLQLKKKGIDLCISVDCGTLAHQPIADAQLDVIVVDHHMSTAKLPKAVAVVNPNRLDESSPYNNLAAVGVSFLLVVAINKSLRDLGFFIDRQEPNLFNLLDLVALGTVCDVMQITNLNRVFVSQGLKVMSKRKNVGLRVLFDTLGILERPSVSKLGFSIGPCINAGGRIGDASLGARLLSTEDEEEAHVIALKLVDLNNERKVLENEALSEALIQAEESHKSSAKFIMVSGNWHQGIIGIIASRLKESFQLPTIVISLNNGIGKASCRSIPGIDIGATVLSAKFMNFIVEGGGHNMAAGFSIEENKINDLRRFFTEKFSSSTNEKLLKIDGVLSVKSINSHLWNQLRRLEPFGIGNPEPRFIIHNVQIRKPKIIGTHHIRCFIAAENATIVGVAFRSVNTPLGSAIMHSNIKVILGKISMNYWNGNESLQFLIEDALPII